MKYSVIIPIYNAEKTIRRCLDSLTGQTDPATEIILVNDGSVDGSEAICREYAERFPNIRYYAQDNQGVSAARNLGLNNATGSYVLFVDSDDYVAPSYFRVIDRALAEKAPELLLFSHHTIGRKTYQVDLSETTANGPIETARLISRSLYKQEFNALWSKVFVRSVIERFQLRFDPALSIDEDVNFTFSYTLHIDRICVIPDPLYYFCVENPDSLSRKKRSYLFDQLYAASAKRYTLLDQAEQSPERRAIIEDALAWLHYRGVYASAAELLKYDYSAKTRREKLDRICGQFLTAELAPKSLNCRMLSCPVRHRMTGLIDFSARLAAIERKHRLNY